MSKETLEYIEKGYQELVAQGMELNYPSFVEGAKFVFEKLIDRL